MAERDPRTHAIIGAAMEVHRQLGCGFLEAVYHEALAIELKEQGIEFGREIEIPVVYKSRRLNTSYRADFVCFNEVVVELKALSALSGVHHAQVLKYLKATELEIALLINFGTESLEFKRFILDRYNAPLSAESV